MKDVTLLIIIHRFLITLVLKKVVLRVVIYMLSEVEAKVKTTPTTIEQNVRTVETSNKKDACRAKDQKCNICHKIGHSSKVCQRRQQGAAQGQTQRRFIPKQKPSRFGGKQIHESENDNLYIVDSSGNQIGITDYESVN